MRSTKVRYAHGQISIFIILGIILILLVVLYIITVGLFTPDVGTFTRSTLEQEMDERAISAYATYCIENIAEPLLNTLAVQGGTFNQTDLQKYSRTYDGKQYRTLCLAKSGTQYCVNRILTREEMEQELAVAILDEIDECLTFDYLEERGYDIYLGEKDLDVLIAPESVSFTLEYPVRIVRDTTEAQSEEFYISMSHPLGMMHRLFVDIMNHETTQGFFDANEWMLDNAMQFKILTHKPYPYVLYEIEEMDPPRGGEARKFMFGMELEDKASLTAWNRLYDLEYGCCHVRQSCFKNADELSCREKGGVYVRSSQCQCSDAFAGSDEVQEFDDCGDREHGESWCNNIEGIGGRSSVTTCLDGELVAEMCKDFHEEVCVESLENEKSNAVCKVNRWEDCTRCTTSECCENEQLRDCVWLEKDYDVVDELSSSQCVPKQAPGFRFWEGAGQEICNIGTGYAQCEGSSCGEEWATYSATACGMLGNCGINKNILGTWTRSGFLQTDPQYRVQQPDFPDVQFTKYREQETLLFAQYIDTIELIPALLSTGINYLDDTSSGRESVVAYNFCGVWQPPVTNQQCERCMDYECTPYLCHSLGQNCQYIENNGVPECILREEVITEEIIIELDSAYDAHAETITIANHEIEGYTIEEKLSPYELIELGIETNVPTQCKITYLPHLPFAETPAIWFGKPEFSTEHAVSFRVPESISVPDRIYEILEISSLRELYDAIVDDDSRIQNIFTSGFMGIIRRVQQGLSNRAFLTDVLRTSIAGLDENTYYTFIRCSDRAGVENEDPVFIRFTIDADYENTNPPKIVHVNPSNGSDVREVPYNLDIFVDKPAECKYGSQDVQFAALPHYFDCETSPMRISSVSGGSYRCTTTTDIAEPFIRCMDNPPLIQKYNFRIREGVEEDVSYNYSDDNSIILGEHHVVRNTPVFLSDRQAIYTISVLVSEYEQCRIGVVDAPFEDMERMQCENLDEDSEWRTWGSMNCTRQFLVDDIDLEMMCVGSIPENRNVNDESVSLEYVTGDTLRIIQTFPDQDALVTGETARLGVVVNRNIMEHGVNCGYSFNAQESILQMQMHGAYQFTKELHGLADGRHGITFKCIDRSGNIAESTVSFYKGR